MSNTFVHINLIGVMAAAVAPFIFSGIWFASLFSKS